MKPLKYVILDQYVKVRLFDTEIARVSGGKWLFKPDGLVPAVYKIYKK